MVDIEKKVEALMREWMPKTSTELEAAIEVMLDEEQDLLIVLFGPPGKGKSNFGFLLSIFATQVVNEHLGLKRKFDLKKQTAWLGADYMGLFKEPASKLATLLQGGTKEQLRKLQEQSKGIVYWLDEAKDLSALDMMNSFNRTFSGILATCRALQHIYILCVDSPTKLLTDIREFRINLGQYVFISKNRKKFGGKTRNVRVSAMYGRTEWSRLIFSDNKTIRSSLLRPSFFINKFKPYVIEPIPLFPESKISEEYEMSKYGSMGRIILEDLEKWEKKTEGKSEGRDQISGIPCRCLKCGHGWSYGGKKKDGFARVSCPNCDHRRSLDKLTANYLPWNKGKNETHSEVKR